MITDSIVSFFIGFILWLTSPLPASSWGDDVPELPALITDAATTMGGMDYFLPLGELVAVAQLTIAIKGSLFLLWFAGWIYARIPFKGT